jgi:hypothetical protein
VHVLALNNPLTQVVISNDGNDRIFKKKWIQDVFNLLPWIDFFFSLTEKQPI